MSQRACPCGSGRPLAACCGVYLDNQRLAPTAEALMRSRYTAFVLGNSQYLLDTWAPEQRPPQLDLRQDRTEWRGLEIVSRELGGEDDSQGRVKFIARYILSGKEQALCEHSRFRKEDDRWLYIDGDIEPPAKPQRAATSPNPPGRNDPCPCGSGLKWKRCCGK